VRVPDLDSAGEIAGKLCADSLAWAKTVAFTVLRGPKAQVADSRPAGWDSELEEALLEEIVAYGLCLLELRLSAAARAEREAFVAAVRHECGAWKERRVWRRRNRHRRLPAPGPASQGSQSAAGYLECKSEAGGQGRVTKEMFEQFCRGTGLSSSVLVGKGENLASLVFYIALHGVLSADGPLSREQVLDLLRAARECRIYLEKSVAGWLAGGTGAVRLAIGG
jgi:hypothetical protein